MSKKFQFNKKLTIHQEYKKLFLLLKILKQVLATIRSLLQGRIHKLKNCVNSRPKSIFKDQEAVKCLSSLHGKYVIVPVTRLPTISCLYVNHITSNV
jgi:hypothetical protein